MDFGSLSDFFQGIAYRRLTATEIDPATSHGHEVQGSQSLCELLGTDDRRRIRATMVFLSDEHDVQVQEGTMSWYNSRRRQPHRSSEYRLYYDKTFTIPIEHAQPNDLFIVARKKDDSLAVIVAHAATTYESQIMWLFGIDPTATGDQFGFRDFGTAPRPVDVVAEAVLDSLGVEVPAKADYYLSEMLRAFNGLFPTTAAFSDFARRSAGKVDIANDPDGTLMCWWEHEELLFRTLEKHIIQARLAENFADADDFLVFSKSVHQRRYSRAGYALQNHIAFLFDNLKVRYAFNKVTEKPSRPDFIFPSIQAYHDTATSPAMLNMLAVKSTCKDRWRQALAEAARIPDKHLFTLEPSITTSQTDEMDRHHLRLVVPARIHATYTLPQRSWLLNLASFIDVVRNKQCVP